MAGRLIGTLFLAILGAGCVDGAGLGTELEPNTIEGNVIPHKTLLKDGYCHIDEPPAQKVIRRQADLDAEWRHYNECRDPDASTPRPDFSETIVARVLSDTSPCVGMYLNITKVTRSHEQIRVYYDERTPKSEACLTAMDKQIHVVSFQTDEPGAKVSFHKLPPKTR